VEPIDSSIQRSRMAAPAYLDQAAPNVSVTPWRPLAATQHQRFFDSFPRLPPLVWLRDNEQRDCEPAPTVAGAAVATMRIACATDEDQEVVLGLIEDARTWLRTKDTNQWEEPWPSQDERDGRVRKGLEGGKTWIVWDGKTPAATVTIARDHNPTVWSGPACTCNPKENAVYVHRLITARSHAGWGLGAALIDWAGLHAARQYGAKWIRIDVWTSNTALHDYYWKRGFRSCGFCSDSRYPSGALFQKPVEEIEKNNAPKFKDPPEGVSLA
jgi:GNAT superfamily N-acetyltransferase